MWIAIHALGFLYLINGALCQNPASTSNPECSAMHRAAESLKNGINFLLSTSSSCQVNPHCSGINCTWHNGGFFEVELHHCEKPIKYHFHFTSPKHGVNEDRELREGDSVKLYEANLVTFKIKVSNLQRTGSTVSTQVDLETCTAVTGCRSKPLLPRQKFCVRMQKCPGYNASSSEYAPCHLNPSASGPTDVPTHTQHTQHGSSTRSSSHKHPTHRGPGYSTSHSGGSAAPGVHGHRKGNKNGDEDDSSHGLSLPAIIGISVAGMFALLIVAGVVVYWKKYHRRTRLRAAYYNDISMHDPLYEDFGPEVA